MSLNGKVAIVTGGAAGIGRGIAQEFLLKGCSVIIADIDKITGEEVEKELSQDGVRCAFIQTDVSNAESVKMMVDFTLNQFGRVDYLINNAGIVMFKPLTEMELSEWDSMFDVDLKGVFLCSKYVIPVMKENGGGVVINIASNHAIATLPDSEAYAAAKSGIISLTNSLALSYGFSGIRAVAICPGFVDTPHYRRWLASSDDPVRLEHSTVALHPVGRILTPRDVGKLATFLASDDAEMITGTAVIIDGGVSARLYNQ